MIGERYLTEEQVEQFVRRGYVVVHDCFSRDVARAWTDHAWVRMGCSPDDLTTWPKTRQHLPAARRVEWREFAPRAWGAACELVGGEDRLEQPALMGDSFIVNFNDGADRDWEPPSAVSPGWHKDGDFFRHFLDSPEQALLSLFIWSDIEPRSGGTFLAGDSVAPVARLLAAHPEGLRPNEFDFRALAAECTEFAEFTGTTGDVVLLHPYILHASSQNPSGRPRFLTNPALHLREPMRFARPNPADYSAVEIATLRALGVTTHGFAPTAPRERIVPEREIRQRRMLEEEAARLGSSPQ